MTLLSTAALGARMCTRTRNSEPGVTCAWRVFRFCKQPLEVGENIRDERGPPRIFGGRRLRKQDQKITGLGHGFTPAGGRCGEKNVQFLLALGDRRRAPGRWSTMTFASGAIIELR